MAKIHFNPENRTAAVCGRTGRMTEDVNRVTCLSCKRDEVFKLCMEVQLGKEAEAFLAQEPREVKEPWKEGVMTCGVCLGTLFRESNRTCYGHYANYVCAACGGNESRLTETGMSF